MSSRSSAPRSSDLSATCASRSCCARPAWTPYGRARVHNGPALAGHGAQAVRDAIASSITTLPVQLRRSLTSGQGAEMAQHADLRIDTGLAIYFCDRTARGSATRTKCQRPAAPVRSPTSVSTARPSSTPSRPRSTAAPARRSATRHPRGLSASTSCRSDRPASAEPWVPRQTSRCVRRDRETRASPARWERRAAASIAPAKSFLRVVENELVAPLGFAVRLSCSVSRRPGGRPQCRARGMVPVAAPFAAPPARA